MLIAKDLMRMPPLLVVVACAAVPVPRAVSTACRQANGAVSTSA